MAERFSSEYPEEFEKILMNCGAKEQDFPKVYRIAVQKNRIFRKCTELRMKEF